MNSPREYWLLISVTAVELFGHVRAQPDGGSWINLVCELKVLIFGAIYFILYLSDPSTDMGDASQCSTLLILDATSCPGLFLHLSFQGLRQLHPLFLLNKMSNKALDQSSMLYILYTLHQKTPPNIFEFTVSEGKKGGDSSVRSFNVTTPPNTVTPNNTTQLYLDAN